MKTSIRKKKKKKKTCATHPTLLKKKKKHPKTHTHINTSSFQNPSKRHPSRPNSSRSPPWPHHWRRRWAFAAMPSWDLGAPGAKSRCQVVAIFPKGKKQTRGAPSRFFTRGEFVCLKFFEGFANFEDGVFTNLATSKAIFKLPLWNQCFCSKMFLKLPSPEAHDFIYWPFLSILRHRPGLRFKQTATSLKKHQPKYRTKNSQQTKRSQWNKQFFKKQPRCPNMSKQIYNRLSFLDYLTSLITKCWSRFCSY